MSMSTLLKSMHGWYRRRFRLWLRGNPKSLRTLRRFSCFSSEHEALARGFAIGLFFGLTPTVGVQTVLVLSSCLLLKANFPMAFAATWISNPLTMAPLYLTFNSLGEYLMGEGDQVATSINEVSWVSVITEETVQMLIGSLIIAAPVAILGYLGFQWVLRSQGQTRH